jgi:hypothetical protein
LNAHATTEEKSHDSKDRFDEKLKQTVDHFPMYCMKIMLGDFNAKLVRGDIVKPTGGNERLYQDSKHTCVRIAKM